MGDHLILRPVEYINDIRQMLDHLTLARMGIYDQKQLFQNTTPVEIIRHLNYNTEIGFLNPFGKFLSILLPIDFLSQ